MNEKNRRSEEELEKTGNSEDIEITEGTEKTETAEASETAGAEADPESGTEPAADEADSEQEASGKEDSSLTRAEKKALEKLESAYDAMKDKHLRVLAEYENFRKRTEREKADIYAYAIRDAMGKLLPVMDNLERGVSAIPEDAEDDPFAEGMKQICKQFEKALEDIGVKPMDAKGKPFDPVYHQAVMHVEDPELDKNVVAAELLKGYTYKDTVVRHAMVSVAN